MYYLRAFQAMGACTAMSSHRATWQTLHVGHFLLPGFGMRRISFLPHCMHSNAPMCLPAL